MNVVVLIGVLMILIPCVIHLIYSLSEWIYRAVKERDMGMVFVWFLLMGLVVIMFGGVLTI